MFSTLRNKNFYFFNRNYFVICLSFQFGPVQNFCCLVKSYLYHTVYIPLRKCPLENILGKGENAVNPFPKKPCFLKVCNKSILKTLWEKEKLLVTSNFSFSHSVFYPFGELFVIVIQFEIVVCKLFQFGRV